MRCKKCHHLPSDCDSLGCICNCEMDNFVPMGLKPKLPEGYYVVEFNDGTFQFFNNERALNGLGFLQVKQIFLVPYKTRVEDLLFHIALETPSDWIKLAINPKFKDRGNKNES